MPALVKLAPEEMFDEISGIISTRSTTSTMQVTKEYCSDWGIRQYLSFLVLRAVRLKLYGSLKSSQSSIRQWVSPGPLS
jgi:hypothetical protein